MTARPVGGDRMPEPQAKTQTITPTSGVSLINLTPHDIVIADENCQPMLVIPRHTGSSPARVRQQRVKVGEITVNGVRIPISRSEYGEVEGLPEPQPGVYYIVSMFVAQALPHRTDLLVPDTGPGSACRDEKGRIVGVKYLMTLAR